MRFLTGHNLTTEIQRLAQLPGPKKVAISYWGKDALKLLDGLDPSSPTLQVTCCLNGGKSDPDVIGAFRERARQNDFLHAKVFWTPSRAIVGSANASSNGLPEEDGFSRGLIEAGFAVEEPTLLAEIEGWLDKLFRQARAISQYDLDTARKARQHRIQSNPRGDAGSKMELIDLTEFELSKLNYSIFLWTVESTTQLDRKVEKLEGIEHNLRDLSWYLDSRKHAQQYPYGQRVLAFKASPDRTRFYRAFEVQFFPAPGDWKRVRDGGVDYCVILALDEKKSQLPFIVGERSWKEIHTRLKSREGELSCFLDNGYEDGFVSWEPISTFLQL